MHPRAWLPVIGLGLIACGKADEVPEALGYRVEVPSSVDELESFYRSLLNQPSCLQHVERGRFLCEIFRFVPCEGSSPGATPVESVPPACAAYQAQIRGASTDRWCLVGPHFESPPEDPIESREAFEEWCGHHWWAESEFSVQSCSQNRGPSLDGGTETGTTSVASASEACLLFPLDQSIHACRAAFCN